jgi:GNAT superfamily N-acetyltransferase
MITRRAESPDWPLLWPLLAGMGVKAEQQDVRTAFRSIVLDDRWLVLVAESGGALLGYAAAQDHGPHLRAPAAGRIARLHDLYVAPDHRRLGVGRALMVELTSWAAERVAYLQWQAREGEAAAFYEALGHRGDPCPQPEFPEFEIAFKA